MTIILDGKKTAEKIKAKLKAEILQLNKKPCLAVVLVGNNPASKVYVNMKEIACEDVGIVSKKYNLKENVSEKELIELIRGLNEDSDVNGILVQLPLPKQIDEKKIISLVNPLKDVDGFHPINIGNLASGKEAIVSCTPKGVVELLDEYNVEVEGKDVVIVGRSNIVGKPLIQLFLNKNATVTICHSKTKNLGDKTNQADILVAAIGKPKFITKDMLKENVVVIDVGINRIDRGGNETGYTICGDVDFENVKEKCSYITPVPGGIGAMTVAMLLKNTLNTYKKTITAR